MSSTAPDTQVQPDTPAAGGLPLIINWAKGQPVIGSVIEYSGEPSSELLGLLDIGWRALWVCPHPYKVAEQISNFSQYGGRGVAICANLALTDDRLTRSDSPALLVAGIHPNQLYPLFSEPNAPLPAPFLIVINRPTDGFKILDTLSQWVRVEAFKLTVADDAEAADAGAWLSAGWKVLAVEGLTIWATRAF